MLSGKYKPIESLVTAPINNSGVTAYINISSNGALTINLSAAMSAGDAICVHVIFIAA